MKIQSLISLTMVASLITACSDEMEQTFNYTEGVLTATVEGNSPDSRVSFSYPGGIFSWSKDDKIGVTTSNKMSEFSPLTLNSGAGTGSGSFSGSIVEGAKIQGYAVYPYYKEHSINGSKLSYYFPASYEYGEVDEDYSTLNKNSFNTAMWGEIQGNNVKMKHLGGVFYIKIEKMPVTKGKLVFTTDKAITGTFSADLTSANQTSSEPSSELPTLKSTGASTTNNTVTIQFDNVKNNKGVFYVPVPTGTYNNVRIQVFDKNDSEKINVVTGNYTIGRAKAKRLIIDVNATISVTDIAPDAEKMLNDQKTVSVTNKIKGNCAIIIPAGTSSLMLESVEKNAFLNVSGSADMKPVSNFTLSIPNDETITNSEEFLDVEISRYNTIVTLAGNGGAAKYGTVTASFKNKLVLSSGVVVNMVHLTKISQNVSIRVCNGATLTNITSEEGVGTITIYKEDGATLPEGLENKTDDNIEVVDANAVEAAELQEFLTTGDDDNTYKLTTDVTGDFVVSTTNPVTINLNGHTITNKSGDTFTVNKNSSLTINGSGTVDNISHKKACIYNNGSVILDGGTYTRSKETNTNSYYNILNHGSMQIQPTVTVKQTGLSYTMIANGYTKYDSGDSRSGYVKSINYEVPMLTINGGTFNGGMVTIKNDENGTLNITDGTFTNGSQTIIQNYHEATITGGEFDGSKSSFYVIDNYAYNADYAQGIMTISGGTFTSKVRYFVTDGVTNSKMSITGGTFINFNPGNNGSNVSFLADGYAAYLNGVATTEAYPDDGIKRTYEVKTTTN